MALIQITNQVFFGFSTDTKVTTGIPTNTLLFELDTGSVYKFTGGVWSFFSGKDKTETLYNKTLVTPVIASVKDSQGYTNTFPTGANRTLVARDSTDVLTNKTLTQPVISTIYNAGVITLPSGTQTLMGRSTNDTVSGKTFSVNSNTLTATSIATGDTLISNGVQFIRLPRGSDGQVLTSTPSTIQWSTPTGAQLGTIQTWTAAQTFNDTKFLLRNPANTFSITVKGGAQAAARAFTFPVASGDDTIELTTTASTPTNKTIGVDTNTIKHSTTNAAGDILVSDGSKFNVVNRGTLNQVFISTANNVGWSSFNAERTGTAQASGNGSSTLFNVPHGLGGQPYCAFIQCRSHSIAFTYTYDTTNIAVTFASAPPSGTNNVLFDFRVVQ